MGHCSGDPGPRILGAQGSKRSRFAERGAFEHEVFCQASGIGSGGIGCGVTGGGIGRGGIGTEAGSAATPPGWAAAGAASPGSPAVAV